ncbi:uncharacterized protein [Watersipora subatra]|uniref:uncharacterized protein n=1 Tax=Watersipora subatra TaxID=2589382 RepID=UPI00355B39AA
MVTDNGPQFVSNEFDQFCTMHVIKHITSPAFHPASNGEAERFVQTLKQSVETNCERGEKVKTALQLSLTAYRCLPHPSLNWKSLAEVLHGRQPRNTLTLLKPIQNKKTLSPGQASSTSSWYEVDSLVYARNYSGVWRRHANQLQARLQVNDTSTNDNIITASNDLNIQPAQSVPDERPVQSPRYPTRNRRRPDYFDSSKFKKGHD